MLTLSGLKGPGFGPVNARVAKGSCLAVMGSSGAGKTRLLRAVADLDPSTGDCLLNGVSRKRFAATEWRRRVAYVPAEPGWWAATAADHFFDRSACIIRAERLGVEFAALNRPIEQLSTGERQRLAFVRALQFKPDALLLDEPTGPLDARTTDLVEGEILDQMQHGVGIFLVTHDLAQAERLGADIYTIGQGRVLSPVREGEV